jgi:predicted DNA-binding helix-hairpin-helix protein
MRLSKWVYEQMVAAAAAGQDVTTDEFVRELSERANAIFGESEVTRVYFSEFVPVIENWRDALKTMH